MASRRGRSTARRSDGPTKAELYDQARRQGIEGRSKMSKEQLARVVGRGGQRSPSRSASVRRSGEHAHPVEVQRFLEGVGYPTRKDRLVAQAQSQGASRDVRETIERLPEREFGSPTEVSEAIGSLA
jgi:hypothetical protein